MSLTCAQIVTEALAISKSPGFLVQGGRALNFVLDDLAMHRNLKVNCKLTSIAVTTNNRGPYSLPATYLRLYSLSYIAGGNRHFLIPSNLIQFDVDSSSVTGTGDPMEWATDLSPVGDGGVGLLYITPAPNANLSLDLRYMIKRAQVTSPESSAATPWFEDQDYLVQATAMRMMRVTDDSRYETFVLMCDKLLSTHLLTEGDEQQVVKSVKLDPRMFRMHRNLSATKTDPW